MFIILPTRSSVSRQPSTVVAGRGKFVVYESLHCVHSSSSAKVRSGPLLHATCREHREEPVLSDPELVPGCSHLNRGLFSSESMHRIKSGGVPGRDQAGQSCH